MKVNFLWVVEYSYGILLFFKFYRFFKCSVEAKFKQPLSNFEAENRKKLSNLSLAEKTVAYKIESSVSLTGSDCQNNICWWWAALANFEKIGIPIRPKKRHGRIILCNINGSFLWNKSICMSVVELRRFRRQVSYKHALHLGIN